MKSRESKIKKIIRDNGIDGIIVLSPENFHYITGMGCHQHSVSRFSGVSIAVVSANESTKSVAISMDFEEPSLQEKITNCTIKKYDTWVGVKPWLGVISEPKQEAIDGFKSFSGSLDILVETIKEMGLENKKIGIEMDFVSVNYFNMLIERLPHISIENITPLFILARSVKTTDEIEIFRKITNIADLALNHTRDFVKVGVSEKELSDIYRIKVMESKICIPSTWAFFTTGSNGARLALSNDKKIEVTDILKFDGGVNVEWDYYTTDFSRTWLMADAPKEHFDLKDRLYESQRLMIDNIKPGVPISEIFNIGYNYVKDVYKGYERGHMGHSISMGPQTAEAPIIAKNEHRLLEEGMILCVESPCYISGVGGYNIEDMVVVTDKGCEVLTPITPHYL